MNYHEVRTLTAKDVAGVVAAATAMPAGAMVYVELLAWSAVRPLTASWSLWLLGGSLECVWGVSFFL